jgi:hypothetical protein
MEFSEGIQGQAGGNLDLHEQSISYTYTEDLMLHFDGLDES